MFWSILIPPAAACVCLVDEVPRVFPDSGAVPPNVRPLVQRADADVPLSLVDGDGLRVDVAVHRSRDAEIVPATPLQSGGTYRLLAGEDTLATYTVADAADRAAPSGGSLLSWAWQGARLDDPLLWVRSSCPDAFVELAFAPATDDGPIVWEAQASRDGDFSAAETITWMPDAITGIGAPACEPTTFAGLELDAPLHVRHRMRDVAGNVTTWSAPVSLTPGRKPYAWPQPEPTVPLVGLGLLTLVGGAVGALGVGAASLSSARGAGRPGGLWSERCGRGRPPGASRRPR